MAAPTPPFQGPRPADFYDVETTSERAVVITCSCIVAASMILRTLGRYALSLRAKDAGTGHYLGLDDIFNLFAVLTFYALAVAVLVAIDRGMGTHIDRVIWLGGSKGLDRYNLAIYVCALTYNSVLGFVKLSVLALYRRILQGVPSKTLVILNWCVIGLVATNTTINVFVAAFQCNPIHAAFDSNIKGAKCINPSAFYIGNAITGIITDSAVYLLSIPIIRPLQINRKRKLAILLTMLVGLFAVVTSCVRLSFLPSLLVNPDASYAMGVPMDWSVVEPTVGILVSSMPAIRSVTYLWSPARGKSQNSNSMPSHLESRTRNGHIKLDEFNGTNDLSHTEVSAKKVPDDDDSERNLIYQGVVKSGDGIAKTTEIHISRT
ncbi:hypothetical protein F5884DRAFT_10265 [Xylogone sp. PMI_703]|nr:hypothetical protein F5884DRAFT_10265 [Xylogone sp. PMI_703]